MEEKNICFLSTNQHWGGSEILWTYTAEALIKSGWNITAGVYYDSSLIENRLKGASLLVNLHKRYRYHILGKILKRLGIINYQPADNLRRWLKTHPPRLVIISQGNNLIGYKLMQFCQDNNLEFLTLTHLVTDILWPTVNDKIIEHLCILYKKARWNFFVSNHVRNANEAMLGCSFENAGITYNPFTKKKPTGIKYPSPDNGFYRAALLGRLECFHKGYDLLIEVLKQEKWRQRPILFSIYGQGPHLNLLKRMISNHAISNAEVYDHTEDVSEIWKKNHLLVMPSRMEGQSLSLIESMHYKRTAVLTAVGGVDELVDDNHSGFIAAFATAFHLDEALERAWQRRENWQEMGEAAYRQIQDKHPEDAVTYFKDQILALLPGKPLP